MAQRRGRSNSERAAAHDRELVEAFIKFATRYPEDTYEQLLEKARAWLELHDLVKKHGLSWEHYVTTYTKVGNREEYDLLWIGRSGAMYTAQGPLRAWLETLPRSILGLIGTMAGRPTTPAEWLQEFWEEDLGK